MTQYTEGPFYRAGITNLERREHRQTVDYAQAPRQVQEEEDPIVTIKEIRWRQKYEIEKTNN